MVEPAQSREGLNLAFTRKANFCCTTCWSVLRKSKMSPVLMVVELVGRQQSFEMPLIQDYHVVSKSRRQLPTQRSATPFCHGQPKAVRVGSRPMSQINVMLGKNQGFINDKQREHDKKIERVRKYSLTSWTTLCFTTCLP